MAHKESVMNLFEPKSLLELISQEWKPSKLQFKPFSILEANEEVIFNGIHSATKQYDHPVVKKIFKKFPYADCYATRAQRIQVDPAGSVKMFGDGQKERYILNMFIQERPGLSKTSTDNLKNRLKFFEIAFEKAYSQFKFESAAFSEIMPGESYYQGNYWHKYIEVIIKQIRKFPKVRTVMYLGDRSEKFPSKVIKVD